VARPTAVLERYCRPRFVVSGRRFAAGSAVDRCVGRSELISRGPGAATIKDAPAPPPRRRQFRPGAAAYTLPANPGCSGASLA
jgi:hypothetical protein